MNPNYGNYYENYDQRKSIVNPLYNSAPMNENYYQRPPNNSNNLSYNPEQSYYEMKYNSQPTNPHEMKYVSQAPPPGYSSYNPNPNPNIGNVIQNHPQSSVSYPYGNQSSNQSSNREDVSFYLQSFENYFQQQGKKF